MGHRLRILHISDLHISGDWEREAWRRRRVLGDAWKRNLDDVLQDGPVDLVAFTGDLAFSGRRVEYEGVGQFLDEVLSRLKCPRERLFLVPGNHDVDRSISPATWKELRSAALHLRLGYRETLRLPGKPFAVHIIGLDSAWMAGDDNDSGRLWLTDDQRWPASSRGVGNSTRRCASSAKRYCPSSSAWAMWAPTPFALGRWPTYSRHEGSWTRRASLGNRPWLSVRIH